MTKNNNLSKTFTLIIILSLAVILNAAEKPKAVLKIDKWLTLGPVQIYQPILNDTAPKRFGIKEMLEWNFIDFCSMPPAEGMELSLPVPAGSKAIWKTTESSEIVFKNISGKNFVTAHLVTYISANEYLKTNLDLQASSAFEVYFDGKSIKQQTSIKENDTDKSSTPISIEPGFHQLYVKMISKPGKTKNISISFSAVFTSSDKDSFKGISVSTSPNHAFTIHEILNLPTISNASISFDGKYILVGMTQTRHPEGDNERWVEIRRSENGELIKSYRGLSNFGRPQWAPESNRFVFTSTQKDTTSLWLVDFESGESKPLLEDIKNFGYFNWSPDGTYLIYSTSSEEEKDKKGVKRIESLRDRQEGYRNKSSLYILGIKDKVSLPISISDQNSDLVDISPNGRNILISKEVEDYSERPYFKTEFYNLDLTDMHYELLLKASFINNAIWSPDGKKILILGSPSLFNNLGKTIAADRIPSDYDTQAYILDPITKEAVAISKDFNPSIGNAVWSKYDGNIYFDATDGQRHSVYKFSVVDSKYSKINVPLQSIRNFNVAAKSSLGVCLGTTTDYPSTLYLFDATSGTAKLIFDPVKTAMSTVVTGKVEEWSFTNKEGITIEGRLHFPPDFNPSKQYPCIVHYYGGTSPIDMSYGGRYPNNWWAALGYIVYVIQPRGTVGYGQDFSAYHVNDWGKYALFDIIEGTEKLLASHPFIDSKRVGCIGASYGGFTTELLIARTNIFAAAVSHAGISSLASYWGGGYWGYEYSGVATADKFPWNAPEIYIDRSPLYNADKIKTPLLLLHGSVDTNVPTLESDYLFTALKLLGREVEYIKVLDQDHWVIDYKKRIQWYKTIIAWFEARLKGKPAFWESLYPVQKMPDAE